MSKMTTKEINDYQKNIDFKYKMGQTVKTIVLVIETCVKR